MHNFILAVIFLAITAISAFGKVPIRSIDGVVSEISDGDSIQVTDSLGNKIKVRLYGIDCPETEKLSRKTGRISKPGQPYGEETYRVLQGKLQGQRVRVDVMTIDRDDRTVSIVWIGNRNINREMVAEGWAWAYQKYPDRPLVYEYVEAEKQAKTKRLGLWQQNNPQPPWEFRRSLRIESLKKYLLF
jgi:endonuclease YncB( thermonuclease family)